MSDEEFNYRIQLVLTDQELVQFRALYAEMQSEIVEMFLEVEQHGGFQTANDVINRIRSK
jgi:uncharacterized protein YehS (DUF1456 family)